MCVYCSVRIDSVTTVPSPQEVYTEGASEAASDKDEDAENIRPNDYDNRLGLEPVFPFSK